MKLTHLQPKDLFDSRPFAFTQVVVSEGGRLVHCSGQTAWDENLNIIGAGDLAKQAEHAFENLRRALAAAGAGPQHVARLRLYVVQYDASQVQVVTAAVKKFFDPHEPPASTLIGVQALALPEFLIEIEATAVLD